MVDQANGKPQGTCFVIMGFGKKTDFETGRVLDLDKSYKNMIKPAVQAAGLNCVRADEIVHSGLIDSPMYEQLLNADVVVADLSTSNKNALYELGVRHALRPFTTVIIAEDGIKIFPFDLSHVAIQQYHHLGEDIGFDEVMRFRGQLTNAISIILNNPPSTDSPVYAFLNTLTPPAIAKAINAAVNQAIPAGSAAVEAAQTHSVLMHQVDKAQAKGDWLVAKSLLSDIRDTMEEERKKRQENALTKLTEQEDPYIIQRLALLTYKSKSPTEEQALNEACTLLWLLNPGTSNDTETLGLWGSTHKRLWEIKKEVDSLNEAVRAYERGFYIRNDYYNGINFAFLLNVRSGQAVDPAEAIADFVEARRVRQEVLQICNEWLTKNPMPDPAQALPNSMSEYLKNWYWVCATKGEALIGLGETEEGQKILDDAYAKAPESWMKGSTEEQLDKLTPLLANSPLRFIKTDSELNG